MISFVIPTRDRPEQLAQTLAALGRLGPLAALGGAEVLIVDNASVTPVLTEATLNSGVPIRVIRREINQGAAARNTAAWQADPASRWLVMLDDDSQPIDDGFVAALSEAPCDVGAVAAEILLPTLPGEEGQPPRHEAGGLPEVFVGCGVAIRRDAFLKLGGYDPAFDYYAEEYDLSAKLLLAGYRVVFDRRFRVLHSKAANHRRFSLIIRRLVRNNGWVAQRYAPDEMRTAELHEVVSRYASIAFREKVLGGYCLGLGELVCSLGRQVRCPMPGPFFDRFTGLEHARRGLLAAHQIAPLGRVAVVDPGKNAWAVARAVAEMGLHLAADPRDAETLVIGTLSPGPLLDALIRRAPQSGRSRTRLVSPWIGATMDYPVYPLSTIRPRPVAGLSTSFHQAA